MLARTTLYSLIISMLLVWSSLLPVWKRVQNVFVAGR
jgi:hypothetical protein